MKQFYVLGRVFLFVFVLGLFSCENEEDFKDLPSGQISEGDNLGPESVKADFSYVDNFLLARSNFYKHYSKKDIKMGNESKSPLNFLDSLLLEKTIVYERDGTMYYTIPYKHSNQEAFYNLYIQESGDDFIPFKLKYSKGVNYPSDPHDLQVELLPFHFSAQTLNRSSCYSTSFYVEVRCTGDGHWPGDNSCNCGKAGYDCEPGYTVAINGQVCQTSTLDDDPDPGNPWSGGGGGSGGDPTTNPNDPTQPGGGFDCMAGYDCAGDPYQNQKMYNSCKYISGGTNCWALCEYANCNAEEMERFELYSKLNVSEQEVSSLSTTEVTAINTFVGDGSDNQKNNFAQEAIGALMDGGNFSEMVASFENIDIDQSLKDTCAESIIIDFILKDFSNLFNSNPLINRTFDKLSSQPSDINIIYKAENIGGNGTTLPAQLNSSTGKWDIVVKIDTDLISNGTQIAVAKTILHESIHAYLRYLQKQNPTIFHANSDFTDLVAAFQIYSDNSYAQHVYMAGLIQEMGQQLSDYAINNLNYPDTGFSYPSGSMSEFYEAISWSGIALINDPTPNTSGAYIYNPVFLQNYIQASDQQRIINIFTAENTGQNSNNTTPLINNNCN